MTWVARPKAPQPAEDRREHRGQIRSIHSQFGNTSKTGQRPSRKGQYRPRHLAACLTATKAANLPRDASDHRRGGLHCSRHARQPDQCGLSSAPQPQPVNPARCQPTALNLHSPRNDRHGGSVQPGLPDAASNSRMGRFCGASDKRFSLCLTVRASYEV